MRERHRTALRRLAAVDPAASIGRGESAPRSVLDAAVWRAAMGPARRARRTRLLVACAAAVAASAGGLVLAGRVDGGVAPPRSITAYAFTASGSPSSRHHSGGAPAATRRHPRVAPPGSGVSRAGGSGSVTPPALIYPVAPPAGVSHSNGPSTPSPHGSALSTATRQPGVGAKPVVTVSGTTTAVAMPPAAPPAPPATTGGGAGGGPRYVPSPPVAVSTPPVPHPRHRRHRRGH